MPKQMTPMMRHYMELKEKHSDCLLFYRLGDFYEMFFEDAIKASKELDLVLTGRDCGLSERAPMCGVPHHSVDNYINRLIDKGYKVAICEQLEDPALAKGLVERDVVRIITPGTVIEEKMLSTDRNNFIAAVFWEQDRIGLSYADVSTGAFYVLELFGENAYIELVDELARIRPSEVLANEALFLQKFLVKRFSSQYYLEPYTAQAFLPSQARNRLLSHFGTATLSGFGCDGLTSGISAAGALIRYLEETQKNALSHIGKLTVLNRSGYMQLDVSTRRNLELTQPLRQGAGKKHTLLHLLDQTRTAMGARMLRDWIDRPLQKIDAINDRLDAVDELFQNVIARKSLQDALSGMYDIERLCAKIVYGTVNARDCLALRGTLEKLPPLLDAIAALGSNAAARIRGTIDRLDDIHALLAAAIHDEPPVGVKEGGIIRPGFHAEVDELRELASGSRNWLSDLEARERESTGIKSLKIGFNRVFGYYIEVTKSYLSQVPYQYVRKQTLTNGERFVTPELKEMEEKILGAEERLVSLEYELFCNVREQLLATIDRLQQDAALLAELDVYQSFAEVAAVNRYCRPAMNESGELHIENGRHPVIERAQSESFIPNDTTLDHLGNRLLIITGPNMAGKSTYMRQVALIALMAHAGSFVPASRANIPLIDRIFTRIGASDDLSAGQSTFMVEMSEMANIIHSATENSLLVIDEIGRGTSTFDGLSIAWAVLERLADRNKCGAMTLFATHYHELTELEGQIDGVKNYRITVREVGDDIVFLRKIVRGSGDKSFGVQVAKLAGIPADVLERAKAILLQLEGADIAARNTHPLPAERAVQMSLMEERPEDGAMRLLREIDPNALTPLEALGKLYTLHEMLKAGGAT